LLALALSGFVAVMQSLFPKGKQARPARRSLTSL
jgi:hypothetical protein